MKRYGIYLQNIVNLFLCIEKLLIMIPTQRTQHICELRKYILHEKRNQYIIKTFFDRDIDILTHLT